MRLAAVSALVLPTLVGAPRWNWRDLPALPLAVGGAFAGMIEGQLIVAGGSYWLGAPWIPGSEKIFSDAIYGLEPGATAWRVMARLPKGLGYGGSFSYAGALWLVGGQSATGAERGILRVKRNGKVEGIGELPAALMNMSTARYDGHFYMLGGQPDLHACLRSQDLARWESCPAWPGPGRFLAQAAATEDGLYLVGGSDLKDGQRVFLRDAYRLRKGRWERLADLPVAVQAGFATIRDKAPYVLSGSDGTLAPFEAELGAEHPGFSPLIWRFDNQRWSPVGRLPYAPVTATLVEQDGALFIAGGEDRPAHRSARVLRGEPINE